MPCPYVPNRWAFGQTPDIQIRDTTFHPSLLSSGILTEADIAASFGDFLVKTRQLIDGE